MIKIKDDALEPFQIWQDGTQFTVGTLKTDKEGKEHLGNASYFSSFEWALKHIAKQKISHENVTVNIQEYLDKYNGIVKRVMQILKN